MPYWTLRVFVRGHEQGSRSGQELARGVASTLSLGEVQASSVMSQRGWRGKQYRERERDANYCWKSSSKSEFYNTRPPVNELLFVLLPNSVWTYYEYVWKEKSHDGDDFLLLLSTIPTSGDASHCCPPPSRSSPSAATRPRRRWTRCLR